jgi:hypothetical protein
MVIVAPNALNLVHGDMQSQDPVSDLPRRHIQQAGGFGLDSAALPQNCDHAFAVIERFIVDIDLRGELMGFATHHADLTCNYASICCTAG